MQTNQFVGWRIRDLRAPSEYWSLTTISSAFQHPLDRVIMPSFTDEMSKFAVSHGAEVHDAIRTEALPDAR